MFHANKSEKSYMYGADIYTFWPIIKWCKVVDDNEINTCDHVPIVCCVKWHIPRYHTKSRLIYNWSKGDIDMHKQTIRDNILECMEPFIIDSKQDTGGTFGPYHLNTHPPSNILYHLNDTYA